MYRLLKSFQRIVYESIYACARLLLRSMGVSFGKNLQSFSVFSIETPHLLRIGDNVWIGRDCSFYADSGITIGNDVMVSRGVSIISSDHAYADASRAIRDQGMKIESRPVVIGDDVWIGEKAIILKEVTIGEGAIIGAGAVVTRDVPPFDIAAGNPARIVGSRASQRDVHASLEEGG